MTREERLAEIKEWWKRSGILLSKDTAWLITELEKSLEREARLVEALKSIQNSTQHPTTIMFIEEALKNEY